MGRATGRRAGTLAERRLLASIGPLSCSASGGGGDPVEPADAESGDVSYGTVEPGLATPYRTIFKAYRYAAVTATVEGQEVELVPIDYVGEELLEPGRYTYELHYEGGSQLGITLVRD